jgi:hypothetical protein
MDTNTLQEPGIETKSTTPQIPAFGAELPKEEKEVLAIYRKAKSLGYADIAISIQEGKRVKLWLTEKLR